MTVQEKYMLRAIQIAQLGAGKVSPNPMVGAVIVHQEQIIGEGWHARFGGPHAEAVAIDQVLQRYPNAHDLLRSSTIYVSLEPCAHFGKTPPCADLIIKYQVPQVIIACQDPFEGVNGNGIARLKDAGIQVVEGMLNEKATYMNRRFLTRVRENRPYVILKWAQTANGYFAPLESKQKWISGHAAKVLAHKWRSEEDAVLVGTNTALADNPRLNVREYAGRNPKRVLIDKNLRLPKNLHLFDNRQETVVFNALETDWKDNTKYVALENFDLYLPQSILYQLYLMDVQSLIVEGGIKTIDMFMAAGLWDEARVFVSGHHWQDGQLAPNLHSLPASSEKVGQDTLFTYFNEKQP